MNNWYMKEIRKLRQELRSSEVVRDVRDYMGENVDVSGLEVVIYYDGRYYKRSNRAGVLSAMKTNGVEVKANTFRNWVLN